MNLHLRAAGAILFALAVGVGMMLSEAGTSAAGAGEDGSGPLYLPMVESGDAPTGEPIATATETPTPTATATPTPTPTATATPIPDPSIEIPLATGSLYPSEGVDPDLVKGLAGGEDQYALVQLHALPSPEEWAVENDSRKIRAERGMGTSRFCAKK